MAGHLNREDMEGTLQALRALSQSLGSCIESLQVFQTKLDKSIQCQQFLIHSLKPIRTGFVLEDREKRSESEAPTI